MKTSPLVSVILATRNEEKNIANCLRSIKEQSYSRIEVIVVDNCSSDRTVEIAQSLVGKVYVRGPNRAAQLNFGVLEAVGEYVVYPDADMILSRKVIEECVERCEYEGYIALYIPEKIVGSGFWIRVRNFERSFYNATCVDAVRFVRKASFLGIGGFDEKNMSFGADDWDFDRRIKDIGRVSIIESCLYHNEGEFNPKSYLSKKGSYADSVSRYMDKWGRNDPIVRKQLGARYRLFEVFVEDGKWKRLVSHPLLSIGMYSLRFMVGTLYMIRS